MGASGFIGSHLIQDLSKSVFTQGFSSSQSCNEKNIFKGDYGSLGDIKSFCNQLDSLIYAAGTVDPRFAQNDQYAALKDSLVGQLDLCLGVFFELNPQGKFIFFSSAGALYPKSFTDIHHEESSLVPVGFYGDLKISQEHLIAKKYGDKDIIVLRPSNIFGDPFKKNTKTGIVDRLINSSITGETVNIFENKLNERDYLFIDDLVSAVSMILTNSEFEKNKGVQTFNLSSHVSMNLEDVIKAVSVTFNGPKIVYSNQANEQNALKISSAKFRELSGWTTKYSFESALQFLKLKLK